MFGGIFSENPKRLKFFIRYYLNLNQYIIFIAKVCQYHFIRKKELNYDHDWQVYIEGFRTTL